MRLTKLAAVAVIAGMLGACEGTGTKQGVGTVLGGVGGAVAGSQFGKGKGQLAATAAGALLGALLGSEVGKSLDRADQQHLNQTTQQTLESAQSGTTATWRNPDSGNYGTVTPQRTYKTDAGQHCREFQQTVTVDGRTQNAYGTACRQPDGSWKIVSS